MLIIQRSGRGATRRERRRAKETYEEKRKRKWLGAKWKEGGQREWLEYNEKEKVMFCTWCKKYEPKAKSVWCIKQIHETNNSKAAAYIGMFY